MKKNYLFLLCALFVALNTFAQTGLPAFNYAGDKLVGHWEFKTEATALDATVGGIEKKLTIVDSSLTEWEEVDNVGTMRLNNKASESGKYSGLSVTHGIAATDPEGANPARVNKYALMFDVKIDLAKTGTLQNLTALFYGGAKSDADFFMSFSNNSNTARVNGVGIGHYHKDALFPGDWNRIIINIDLTKATSKEKVNIYVARTDGTVVFCNEITDNDKWLDTNKLLYLLGDNPGNNEYGGVNVSQIALFNTALTNEEIASLTTFTIANDLIKVSDDFKEYWYYIENGHAWAASGTTYINDNDGRFGTLLSESPDELIRTDLLKPTAQRVAQKWKVVKSETDGYYYLVNQKGNYLNAISGDRTSKVSATATPETGTCNIAMSLANATVETSGLYVKMQAQGISNCIGALNTGGTSSAIGYGAAPNTNVDDKGIHASPRSWRFVPEEDIDTYYPEIYEAETTSDKIYKWYYIKSLDPAITTDAKYMATTGLADKDNAQLFGFVHESYYAGNNNDYGSTDFTQIISKETGEAATISSTSKWAMRHYYTASYNATTGVWTPEIQAVFRTTKRNGTILNNSLALTADGIGGKNVDVFNSVYNWAFEIASFNVAVNAGTNVAIVTDAPATVESGKTIEVTYKVGPAVSDGFTYVPVITVDSKSVAATLPDAEGVYTLSVIVSGNTAINIEAEKAQNEITFDLAGVAGNSVTITSPELVEGKFTTGNVLSVEYSLDAGYTLPTITSSDDNVTIGEPQSDSGKYTVAISGITGATTLTFTNAVITYAVTLPASANGITVGTNAAEADYFNDYEFTFTVDEGYNHPQVYANGIYVSPVKNGDSYTATISDVREDLTITARAFELANVLPVAADTYVSGRDEIAHSTEDKLWLQYSSSSYYRRIYLEFDLSLIDMSAYNNVLLELVCNAINKPEKTEITDVLVGTVPNTLPAISEMTSANTPLQGDTVSDIVSWKQSTTAVGDILRLNVSEYILANSAASSLRLQVAGFTDGDGYYSFYSREGAIAASNMDYMPVLVFAKLPEVTVTSGANVTVTSPTEAGPYVVKTGEEFVLTFTVEAGCVPSVKIDGADATDEQLDEVEGVYTLTLTSVAADTTIDITATKGTGLADNQKNAVSIYTVGSTLVIKSEQAAVFEVFSVSGQLVAKQTVNGESSITLEQGSYLVKVVDQVYKVNLR